MKVATGFFLHLFTVTLSSLATAAITAQIIRYDTVYDNSSTSLSTVACSDGTNGLLTKGYNTFGSLPDFPYIGAAAAVEGYDSANCGSCWKLTYTPSGNGTATAAGNGTTSTYGDDDSVSYSVVLLAVDHADEGFNVAQEALDELTGGMAEELGTVQAIVQQVDAGECGLAA